TKYQNGGFVVPAKIVNNVLQGRDDRRAVLIGEQRSFDQNSQRDCFIGSSQRLLPGRRGSRRREALRLMQRIRKTCIRLGPGNGSASGSIVVIRRLPGYDCRCGPIVGFRISSCVTRSSVAVRRNRRG